MKNYFQLILSFCLVFILSMSSVAAQNERGKKVKKSELKDFLITVSMTDGDIQLDCANGCAWTTLNLPLQPYKPQAVDEYGFTTLDNEKKSFDPGLANFLFTIAAVKEGMEFVGMSGTAWTELQFSLRKGQKQNINPYGMAD